MICPGMWLKLKKLPKSVNFPKKGKKMFLATKITKKNSKNMNIEISKILK
jgi:hypothetical protein